MNNTNDVKKNYLFYMPLILVALGRYIPSQVMLLIAIVIMVLFVWEFIKDRRREKPKTPMYVYITGFIFIPLLVIYLLGRDYLNFEVNTQLILLGVALIAIIIFISMRLRSLLKSGDEDLAAKARMSIFFFAIAGVLGVFVMIGILTMN